MANARMTNYTRTPGVGTWYFDDWHLLMALGVLHRRKRYGKIFYVNFDSAIGSDANTPQAQGTPFDLPLLTMGAALGYCESERGDIIVLQSCSGGSTGGGETEDDISVAIADLTIVGMSQNNGDRGCFTPSTASTTGVMNITADGDNLLLKNLNFNTTLGLGAAISTAAGTRYLTVDGCWFLIVGTTGPTGYGINMTAGAVYHPIIKNSRFYLGTLVLAGIVMTAGASGGMIEDCTITSLLNGSGTGAENGILVTAGTGVIIKGVHIHGGDGSTAYNITDGIDIDPGVKNTLITGPCYIGGCDNALTDGGTDTIGNTNGIVAVS